MNLYKLHTEQLLLYINEFLPEDHLIKHLNSYNYLVREMNEFKNSGLQEQELKGEQINVIDFVVEMALCDGYRACCGKEMGKQAVKSYFDSLEL